MLTIAGIWPRRSAPRVRGRRVLRPWRRQAQLAAQFATRLGVDRRIDRFVGHVLGRLVGVDPFEGSGNLLRGPFPIQQGAHHAPTNGVQVQLTRRSDSGSPGTQQCVGGLTGIAPIGSAVAGQLAADGRGRAIQCAGHGPHTGPQPSHAGNDDPILRPQLRIRTLFFHGSTLLRVGCCTSDLKPRSHEQDEHVFSRGPRARGSDGSGASRRVPVAVGGGSVDCALDWLRAATLLSWIQRHEVDTGVREGVTGAERLRMKALERENRESAPGQRDSEAGQRVFRPGGARPPAQVLRDFVQTHRGTFGVEPICRALQTCPIARRRVRWIVSTGSSGPSAPTTSGSPTSPVCPPGRAAPMSRSSSTSSPGASSAGV